ncbi:MAG: hypothetical protein WCP39_06115, partial [Chlamydiota bacterium]
IDYEENMPSFVKAEGEKVNHVVSSLHLPFLISPLAMVPLKGPELELLREIVSKWNLPAILKTAAERRALFFDRTSELLSLEVKEEATEEEEELNSIFFIKEKIQGSSSHLSKTDDGNCPIVNISSLSIPLEVQALFPRRSMVSESIQVKGFPKLYEPSQLVALQQRMINLQAGLRVIDPEKGLSSRDIPCIADPIYKQHYESILAYYENARKPNSPIDPRKAREYWSLAHSPFERIGVHTPSHLSTPISSPNPSPVSFSSTTSSPQGSPKASPPPLTSSLKPPSAVIIRKPSVLHLSEASQEQQVFFGPYRKQ